MNQHTLILSTAKSDIPKSVAIEFVTNLINNSLTAIEYFGIEIDNGEDFKEEEKSTVNHSLAFIEFYFDTPDKINYDNLGPSEIYSLILDIIKKSANIEVRADDKDITVYL